jgi:hypothetical protein
MSENEELEIQANNEDDPHPFIIAYEFLQSPSISDYELVASSDSPKRNWMDNTQEKFAYRCLPLLMANTIGWQIKTRFAFMAVWNGGNRIEDLVVAFLDNDKRHAKSVVSHFGSGILTFQLPWHFRTSPGHNLFVTGPTNEPRKDIAPLSGIVETDWLPFTFTMNWKVLEKNVPVVFQPGDVVCQFFPYPRGYPEKFLAMRQDITSNPSVNNEYRKWSLSREEFNRKLKDPNCTEITRKDWEKNYFFGEHKDGTKFEEHQTRINSCPFKHPPKGKA